MNVPDDIKSLARRALERCDVLAGFTEEPGRITRTFLSPPMRDVHAAVGGWLAAAGMSVRVDGVGNIVGRYEGAETNAPALLIGSHLDTVPNAGRYDGILGVMLGIATVEALGGVRPGVAIEVVGFSEEEGVRFRAPYIGSKGFIGRLGRDMLGLRDAAGVSVAGAVRAFGLGEWNAAFDSSRYIGYLEAHIEQGPVLEAAGIPLGGVSAIVGQSRWTVTFTGRAAHAGTTPMFLRQDALLIAARWIDRVAALAADVDGLVATVGRVEVEPNASNVVPGRVRLSLDVRHADDATRRRAADQILAIGRQLAGGSSLESVRDAEHATVPMDPALTGVLDACCADAGERPLRMTSGAGHDAAVLAAAGVPSCMLFVRSPGGVSHHPDEAVVTTDVEVALAAMVRFVQRVAARYDPPAAAIMRKEST